MSFQATVNTRPAPAVVGDYASDNPRDIYPAGPGGLVAGSSGLNVGRFAWVSNAGQDWDAGPAIANNFGSGPVTGWVHRRQQALITTYLAESGISIPQGFMVDLLTGGDIWVANSGSSQALYGHKAYANYSTGAVTFAATGAPTAGGVSDASATISAGTASVTGSIAGNILTVTAGTGLVIGGVISGGATVSGTQIVSQLTTTVVGGIGTYVLSIGEQTVASRTIAQTYGLMTVNTLASGAFAVGQLLTGGGTVLTGTYITAFGTASGGAGTYILNLTQAPSPQLLTSYATVETKWYATHSALTGEIVKCSSHALG
jgi:hypothetical protein